MARTSVIIPSREEPYTARTVQDVLEQSTGDIEVIVVLDGWRPDPPIPEDPRVRTLHWGVAQGLRPSLNAAVAIATGQYLFKLDAHCSLTPGFDQKLQAECGEQDVVVPAKRSLIPETWTVHKSPWHHFYLMWPWQQDEWGNPVFVGLQDKNFDWRYSAPRVHIPVEDILSYQGSAWMLRRTWWDRLLPYGMDDEHYYFAQEPQEIGLATWLRGGRVRIVKEVEYGHLWKGQGVHKRRFIRNKHKWNAAMAWSTVHWMKQPGFRELIEKFAPLPGWPADWPLEAERELGK